MNQNQLAEDLGRGVSARAGGAVEKLEQALDRLPSSELPSRPLFGVLPLERVIPQDVHAMADYSNGLTCLATLAADDGRAKIAGAVLGGSVIGVSLLTDYRLSAAKVIPIEAHEVIDYLWGASCIAAPFVLGYYKKSPIAAFAHIATGAMTILASMFTDYRAATGVGRGRFRDA